MPLISVRFLGFSSMYLARWNVVFLRSYFGFEPTMEPKSQRSKRRDDVLCSLDVVIESLKLAESLSSVTPAKAVFSTVGVVLTMIRVGLLLFCEGLLKTNKIHAGLDGQ